MMNLKKAFPILIVALLISGIFAYFFFDSSSYKAFDFVSEKSKQEHIEKIAEYDDFLTEQQKAINELDEESDRLKQRDRDLDEKILQLDKELGLTPEEFNKKYPKFDMNGVYQ
jgi:phage shock protein A